MSALENQTTITAEEFVRVHSLLRSVLEKTLGGPPPVPACVNPVLKAGSSSAAAKPLSEPVQRWLEMLNLSVDVHQLRVSIQKLKPDEPTIQSLIRFLVTKKQHFQSDREKLDWLVTHLFSLGKEHGERPSGWFTAEMEEILQSFTFPPLSAHAEELLAEFPALLDELAYFQKFSQITDSRILGRGRDLKRQFKEEFFHPAVLAAIVNYNLLLGKKMLDLLQGTVRNILESAPEAELPDTQEAIQDDYQTISGFFHQITELDRKAEQSREKKEKGRAPAPSEALPAGGVAGEPEKSARSVEEQLLELGIDPSRQAERHRNRIREIARRLSANPGVTSLAFAAGTVPLSEWEMRALLSESPPIEQSFRADFGRGIANAIGLIAGIEEELPGYFETKGVEHLWKRHCDALIYLLYEGRRHVEVLKGLAQHSEKRGLLEKTKQLLSTADKLEGQLARVSALF